MYRYQNNYITYYLYKCNIGILLLYLMYVSHANLLYMPLSANIVSKKPVQVL